MSDSRQIFSLKQVASSIRKTLEERYQQTYWVKAEMHKLNLYPSGHCFPELLQKENGKIVAQMNASIWKQNYQRINKNFVNVVKEPLREDSTLLLLVKIVFHETFGLSLQIIDIDPNYALGELQRERQETLLRLQKENLINLNQKLDFPLLPKRIALISADTSKGLSDFRKVIETNQWGYHFTTFLFQAYLQGDVAVQSIQQQLKRIEKVKDYFDVVVIVRGGGGEVGLSCYNNFELCKAIASFPLPVLTGIGHSTNLTVAEMIAYRNAITPTELGDFLIQTFHEFAVPVKDASKVIRTYAKNKLENANQALSSSVKLFKNVTSKRVEQTKNLLFRSSSSLKSSVKFILHLEHESITNSHKSIRKTSKESLINQHIKIDSLFDSTIKNINFEVKTHKGDLNRILEKLPKVINQNLLSSNNKLDQLEQSIKLMDPREVLKRGYSITTIKGKTISKESKIKKGDIILTQTFDTEVESEIINLKKSN